MHVAMSVRAVLFDVGDRLDNDVLPALDAGMARIVVRHGPWGVIHAGRSEAARASTRLDGLAELPNVVRQLGERPAALTA